MTREGDLAGERYWERFWTRQGGRRFSGVGVFHRRFMRELRDYARPGTHACEIGCGASVWVPALAAAGVQMSGIDYSSQGLKMVAEHLQHAGTSAELIEADLFDRGALGERAYDVVFSLGLLEHFDDPVAVTRRFLELTKPGGHVLTVIPNFTGAWGRLQRWVDPAVYAVHRIYTPQQMDELHFAAGLESVKGARYFGSFGPLVVNYSGRLERLPRSLATGLLGATWLGQQLVGMSLTPLGAAAEGSHISSHILGVYQRPLEVSR